MKKFLTFLYCALVFGVSAKAFGAEPPQSTLEVRAIPQSTLKATCDCQPCVCPEGTCTCAGCAVGGQGVQYQQVCDGGVCRLVPVQSVGSFSTSISTNTLTSVGNYVVTNPTYSTASPTCTTCGTPGQVGIATSGPTFYHTYGNSSIGYGYTGEAIYSVRGSGRLGVFARQPVRGLLHRVFGGRLFGCGS